jgi:drug/metabolite transporter (DMT)-like permease
MDKNYVRSQNKSRPLAILYLIIASLLWSTGGFFIKWIQWNPIAIAGMRSAISSALIWLVLRRPKFNRSKEQMLCAFAYSATVILFVVANKLTTAANVILLQYTAPVYVALFGFAVLKEKTTKTDWITIIVVLGGMVLFFLDDIDTTSILGNALAVLSGMTFSAVVLLMRKQKNGSPLESILLGNIITAVVGIPFMFQTAPSSTTWAGLILMGTLQLGLPYILYSAAIKSVSALEAVLIPVIEPIVNPIWVFLMIGEIPGKWSIIGGAVVLIAVTFRCAIAAVRPPLAVDGENAGRPA